MYFEVICMMKKCTKIRYDKRLKILYHVVLFSNFYIYHSFNFKIEIM